MRNKRYLVNFLGMSLVALVGGLSSCTSPTAVTAPQGRVLEVTWASPITAAYARTLTPAYPGCVSYNVTVQASGASTPYKTLTVSGSSFQLSNLPSAVYTVTVQGLDSSGNPVASGSVPANLTSQSSVQTAVVLTYLTSGGTGSLQINLLTTAVTQGISSYSLQMVSSAGTTTPTVTPPTTTLTLPSGVYQVLLTAVESTGKKAYVMDIAVVVPDTSTVWNVILSDQQFGATYVPVSSLSVTPNTVTLPIGGTQTLALTWNANTTTPSNELWTSVTPSGSSAPVTLDASGLVTAVQGGTATLTLKSVDNPTMNATVSVDVQPQVFYDTNFGTSTGTGTAPASQQANVGTSVTVASASSLSDAGRAFTGWNTSADGTGTLYQPGASFTMPTTNTTLYAQWGATGTITLSTPGAYPTLTISAPASVTLGVPTSFSVSSSPSLTGATYQWQLNGVNLTDQPGQTGTKTATLNVSPFPGIWQVGENELTVLVNSTGNPQLSTSVRFAVNPVVLQATGNDVYSPNVGWMKFVPGGSFNRDATPADVTSVGNLLVQQTTVSRSQWAGIMGYDTSNTTASPTGAYPAQNMSWYEALIFCNRLSLKEGLQPVYSVTGVTDWTTVSAPTSDTTAWDNATINGLANGYRLPTPSEWQWAAMGGVVDSLISDVSGTVNVGGYAKGYAGSTEASTGTVNLAKYAWVGQSSATISGALLPNEFGLYDMTGNVFQWMEGVFPTATGILVNPEISGSTSNQTLGGSFQSASSNNNTDLSSAGSVSQANVTATAQVGFRVVRDSPVPLPTSGLLGEWKLNNTWNETSGNSLTLTPAGTTAFTYGHRGVANTAANFSTAGSASTATSSKLSFSSTNTLTLSFWMEDVGAATSAYPVLYNGDSGRFQFGVYKSNTNQLTGRFGQNGTWSNGAMPTASYTPGVWQFVVLAWDGSTAYLYLNGVLQSAVTDSNSIGATTFKTLVQIGAQGFIMDDVRLYSRVLTPSEIEALYAE